MKAERPFIPADRQRLTLPGTNGGTWLFVGWASIYLLVLKDVFAKGASWFGSSSSVLLTLAVVASALAVGWGSRARPQWLWRKSALVAWAYLVWLGLDYAWHGCQSANPSVLATYGLQTALFVGVGGLLAAEIRPARLEASGGGRPLTLAASGLKRAFPLFLIGLGGLQALIGIGQYLANPARVTGTLLNPNLLAGFAAFGLACTAGRWRRPNRPTGKALGLYLTVAGLLLAVLWFSGSRGALIGLGAGVSVFATLAFARQHRRLLAGCCLLPLLVGAVHLTWTAVRFESSLKPHYIGLMGMLWTSDVLVGQPHPVETLLRYYDFDENGTLDARDLVLGAHLWKDNAPPGFPGPPPHRSVAGGFGRQQVRRVANSLWYPDLSAVTRFWAISAARGMIRDYPLAGIGPGNWTAVVPDYLPAYDQALFFYHAHNLLIQFWTEAGFPGLLFTILLFGAVVLGVWRKLGAGAPADEVGLAVGLALLCLIFHNQLDITIFFRPLRFIFPVCLALLLHRVEPGRQPVSGRRDEASPEESPHGN